ncbi:hypothetical protein, partial [Escherichia coli]|uniref:hypothetical protein n=1 Tax=Escherichia coli TaxID=562 RepID=UPI0011E8F9E4
MPYISTSSTAESMILACDAAARTSSEKGAAAQRAAGLVALALGGGLRLVRLDELAFQRGGLSLQPALDLAGGALLGGRVRVGLDVGELVEAVAGLLRV